MSKMHYFTRSNNFFQKSQTSGDWGLDAYRAP